MKLLKGFRFRLYPDREQLALFARTAGVCRLVYNLALEQRKTFSRRGRTIGYNAQAGELAALKTDFPFVAAAPHHCLQQALRDLDRAYANFFAGRAGYPMFRQKHRNDSFRFPDPKQFVVTTKDGAIRLPKAGWVKTRFHRSIEGTAKNITISRDSDRWYASIICEVDLPDPVPSNGPAVGIDLNVTAAGEIALSDGTFMALRRVSASERRRERRLNQALARKDRGSKNRLKARGALARHKALLTRRRRDVLHKAATNIVRAYGAIVVEDLRITNMSASARGTTEAPGRNVRAKAGLNRSLLEVAPGTIRAMLKYKALWRGVALVAVDPRNTSRTCPACGHVDPENRRDRVFSCKSCRHHGHADTVAAINILRRGLPPSAGGPSAAACRALSGTLVAPMATKQETSPAAGLLAGATGSPVL